MLKTVHDTLSISPNESLYVIGQDIDGGVIRTLSPSVGRYPGDRVLVEINGKRIVSDHPCPLVAEFPWEVEESNDRGLVLTHPILPRRLTLPWKDMVAAPLSEPAVFYIFDNFFSSCHFYVILQFVAYGTTSVGVAENLQPEWEMDNWDQMLLEASVRKATVDKLVRDLRGLRHSGLGWRSVWRFALRSGVSKSIIIAFRVANYKVINGLSIDILLRILDVLRWMGHYRQQSEVVQISSLTTDEMGDFAGESI